MRHAAHIKQEKGGQDRNVGKGAYNKRIFYLMYRGLSMVQNTA